MNNVVPPPAPEPVPAAPSVVSNVGPPFLVRFFLAGVYGVGAMLLGAVIWGLVAYFLNSIFLVGAFFIGGLVTLAIASPFHRISVPLGILLFLPAVGMTLISIVMGDLLFYTLSAMKEFDMSFMEAAFAILENADKLLTSSDQAGSYIFGGLGAVLAFFNVVRRTI